MGDLPAIHVQLGLSEAEPLYDEYMEMVIQFGYVTMFGWCWPWAAFCSLLNNMIELRTDAWKMCHTFRRPFCDYSNGIGIWNDVLEFISILGVVVNFSALG